MKLELIFTNQSPHEEVNCFKVKSSYHSDNKLICRNEPLTIIYLDVTTFYLEVMNYFKDINYLESEEMWKEKLETFKEEYGKLPSFVKSWEEKNVSLFDLLLSDHIISCRNRGFNNVEDKVYFIMKPYQVSYVDKNANEILIILSEK